MWQIWLICRWLTHLDSLTISETWLTPNINTHNALQSSTSSPPLDDLTHWLFFDHVIKSESTWGMQRERGCNLWAGRWDSCLNRAGPFPQCCGKTPWQPSVSALRLGGEGVYIAEESKRSSQCLADVCWRSAEHLSLALSQRSQTSHSLLTTTVTCV